MATKILILSIGRYPHIGGKSTHIDLLKQLLPLAGFEPTVLSLSSLSPLKRNLANAPRFWGNITVDFALRRYYLKQMLNKMYPLEEFPLVLLQDTPAFPLCDRPFILTLHGSAPDEYASLGTIKPESRAYEKLLAEEIAALKSAQAIIAVDSNLKNQIISRASLPESKVTILPNTVDTTLFRPGTNKEQLKKEHGFLPEESLAIILRRLVPKNGVGYGIQALALLGRPNVKLIIAGDGPERPTLKKLTKTLGLEKQVLFLGSVSRERATQLLQIADVAIVPSVPDHNVIEATSISALEAMATGLPVIASSIGGLSELFSCQEGILVPPRNPEAIKTAWASILDDPSQAQSLGQKALAKVKKEYANEPWLSKYTTIIGRVLKGDKIGL